MLEPPGQYQLLRAVEERVQLVDVKTDRDATAPATLRARRDRAILILLLSSGLRLSEVAGLQIEDMVVKPRSGSVMVIGKGNKVRKVKLNKDARHRSVGGASGGEGWGTRDPTHTAALVSETYGGYRNIIGPGGDDVGAQMPEHNTMLHDAQRGGYADRSRESDVE